MPQGLLESGLLHTCSPLDFLPPPTPLAVHYLSHTTRTWPLPPLVASQLKGYALFNFISCLVLDEAFGVMDWEERRKAEAAAKEAAEGGQQRGWLGWVGLGGAGGTATARSANCMYWATAVLHTGMHIHPVRLHL